MRNVLLTVLFILAVIFTPLSLVSATTNASLITIIAMDQSGNQIRGIFVELKSPSGITIKSGFTPASFEETSNIPYVVHVTDYKNMIFESWSDGTLDRYYSISPTKDIVLTAIYIVPVIGFTPSTGSSNTVVHVSGNHFTPFSTITLKFDSTKIVTNPGTITTNSTGGFTSTTFAVPASTPGVHTVSLIDNLTKTASSQFTVINTLSQGNVFNTTASTTPQTTININSINFLSGKPLSGMHVTITKGLEIVKTGFTPLSFVGSRNTEYNIIPENYGSLIFDHWDDNSKIQKKTILSRTSIINLTAFYTETQTVSKNTNSENITKNTTSENIVKNMTNVTSPINESGSIVYLLIVVSIVSILIILIILVKLGKFSFL